jgi:hypothetical protein
MATVLRIPVHDALAFKLPAEAMTAVGSAHEIYLEIDAIKQTVLLSVRHPDVVHNEYILDQMAKLNEGMSLEEYGEPVPESFLNRRGKGPKQDGGEEQ